MVVLVGEEMFHRAEQKGTEPPAPALHGVEAAPCQEPGKKLLRQFARRLLVTSTAPEKSENRCVVGGAEIAQCRLRLRRIAARLQHLRPLRGDKGGGGAASCGRGHVRRRNLTTDSHRWTRIWKTI